MAHFYEHESRHFSSYSLALCLHCCPERAGLMISIREIRETNNRDSSSSGKFCLILVVVVGCNLPVVAGGYWWSMLTVRRMENCFFFLCWLAAKFKQNGCKRNEKWPKERWLCSFASKFQIPSDIGKKKEEKLEISRFIATMRENEDRKVNSELVQISLRDLLCGQAHSLHFCSDEECQRVIEQK